MTRGAIILATLLAVGGCVSSKDRIGESIDANWLTRRDQLRALDDWRMEGRIALNVGRKGYNGTVSWEQDGESLDFRFRGPFGFGGFRIHGGSDRLRVKTTRGDEFWVTDPVEEMAERFGFSLPVYSMRYWLLGVSDPSLEADEVVNHDGYLEPLEPSGRRFSAASSAIPWSSMPAGTARSAAPRARTGSPRRRIWWSAPPRF